MEHLNLMASIANEIKEATVSAYSDTNIEQYVVSFNSLLMDRSSVQGLPMGPIWSNALFECSVLSEASYFLVVLGFYDEASALLRMMLEGFLTRMYWHIQDKKGEIKDSFEDGKWANKYAKWELGLTGQFPSLKRDVWPTILQEPAFSSYDQKYNLKLEAETSLKSLNKFVHGRPATRHYGGATRSSSLNLRFNRKHIDEWFTNLRAVVVPIFVISFLEYPGLFATKTAAEFASLEPEHASRIREFLQSWQNGRAA